MPATANPSKQPSRHRSPFRYPGGKSWATTSIRAWLAAAPARPRLFLDPFCGGGSSTLTAVAEDRVDHALMVERDPRVAAVWRVIIDGDAEGLAGRIEGFVMTRENVEAELAADHDGDLDLAFQTVLRNRCQHGGIMAPGASLTRRGEGQRGIGSRWYPKTLAQRIRDIQGYRARITFVEGDALAVISEHLEERGTALFLDPPYSAPGGKRAGSRLYLHHELDHPQLFRLAAAHAGPVLLTYDHCPTVARMAAEHGMEAEPIAMHSGHHAKMTELLISPDLSWRGGPQSR